MKKVIIGVVVMIVVIAFFAKDKYYFDDVDLIKKQGKTTWVGHEFEIASSGNVTFTEKGYEVFGKSNFDDSLVTSRLLDVNLNQLIKVTIIADITGVYVSGDWSEITSYIRYGENSKYGFALFGSRDHVCPLSYRMQGLCTTEEANVRDEFNFTWFSIENDGKDIIFEDSSGRSFSMNENTDTEHKFPDRNVEWNLGINSHVKGEGSTSLKIKEIIVES